MAKTLDDLRRSKYHQQLGRKMCAAFVAQQQGIALTTAFKGVEEPVGDLWLLVAEVARSGAVDGLTLGVPKEFFAQLPKLVM